MMDWEIQMDFQELLLEQYAEPLKGEENAKCKRAIEAVRDALINMGYIEDKKGVRLLENDAFSYSVSLHNKNTSSRVEVFVQGSYANNTCASNEGDVDIAVACSDTPMYSFEEFYITPLTQRQTEAVSLKNAIENTLKNKFPGQIYRGNKSIKMHGDEYRKQADIVPCVCMRHLILRDSEEKSTWEEGVVIFADDSTTVMNFPKQHIINENNKDHRTNFNYKKMVRIMKKFDI